MSSSTVTISQIKKYLYDWAKDADNYVVLTEMCADYFDHEEWLDDSTHEIWELGLKIWNFYNE